MTAFHKYIVIKWWIEEDFSLVCNLFQEALYIFMKSHHHLPFYFGSTVYLWEVVFIYHFILRSTVYLRKSSLFTILFWGALYIHEKLSPFTILFWGALHIYKKLYSFTNISCIPLRWRKSYYAFYNPKRRLIKSPPPLLLS